MEVLDKKGLVIITETITVSHDKFLTTLKGLKEVRVGVGGSDEPFSHVFFKVAKNELEDVIRVNQMDVTYSIMLNSKVDKKYHDTLYIHKLRITLFDKK